MHRLEPAEADRLLRQVVGDKRLPSELAEEVLVRTDGVPLFIEELMHSLLDSGQLVEHADEWRTADRIVRAAIPATLQDSLMSRLDRTGPGQLNLFMKNQAIMAGLDHDELLLRVLIGESSHRLSTRFLVDRLTVNNIVHVLGARYPRVFNYVADARAQGLKQGYVERDGLRRYFDVFWSSSMEKRNLAQVLACRWLLQY